MPIRYNDPTRIGRNPFDPVEMSRPTKLDLAIGRYFPKFAAGRIRARREFSYEASRSDRFRNTATTMQGPEDYRAFPERLQLIRQVRDLEQNFGLFQSIIDKVSMYAFGRIKYRPQTGEGALNPIYGEYLEDRFDNSLDLSGRFGIEQQAQIAFKSMLRDGDFGYQWQRGGDGLLKVCGIEGDRIGGIYMVSSSDNYLQGITIDLPTGRPLSFRIYWRTKANSYSNPVEIPADQMMHIFDPRRTNQYRGVTPFAPILTEARDLKEIMEYCRIGTKFENLHAAIGYTPHGGPFQDPTQFVTNDDTDVNDQPLKEQALNPGMIQWASSTDKYDFIKSERPSGTFQTYLETLVRLIGLALNLPYGFLYDLSKLGGPNARMDAQQAHRVIEYYQRLLQRQFLDKVKNALLIEGMGNGSIPWTPQWDGGVWQFAPAISIDAGRDSTSAIKEVQSGMLTLDSWFGETGQDASAEMQIMAQESDQLIGMAQAIAQKRSIPFETALTMLTVRTPNGFIAPAMPPPASDPAAAQVAAAAAASDAIAGSGDAAGS
jgi:capsid protein